MGRVLPVVPVNIQTLLGWPLNEEVVAVAALLLVDPEVPAVAVAAEVLLRQIPVPTEQLCLVVVAVAEVRALALEEQAAPA